MANYLILIEQFVDKKRLIQFVQQLGTNHHICIVSVQHLTIAELQHPDISIVEQKDYVTVNSSLERILFARALTMIEAWQSQLPPFSHYVRALEYEDINLWVVQERRVAMLIYRFLAWIETIRHVLMSEEWDYIYCLGKGNLWHALQVVSNEIEVRGTIAQLDATHFLPVPTTLRGHVARFLIEHRTIEKSYLALRHPRQTAAYMRDYLWHQRLSEYQKTSAPVYLFLVTNYGTCIETLVPVMEQVKTFGQVFVLGYGTPFTYAQRTQHQLNYEWSKYVPVSAWFRIAVQQQRFAATWHRLEQDTAAQAVVADQGRWLWPRLSQLIREIFLVQAPTVVMWLEAIKHIFNTIHPQVVVTTGDRKTEALIAWSIAHRHGAPMLYVQPSMHGSNRPGIFNSDYGAVQDTFARDGHSKMGMKSGAPVEERLIITGLPRWDKIAQVIRKVQDNRESAVVAAYQQLALPTNERLVVIATQPFGLAYIRRIVRSVLRAISQHERVRLILKLHPQEALFLDDYRTMLADMGNSQCPPMALIDINLYTLLVAAELVVVLASNVGLEAAMLNRSVVVANLTGNPDIYPYVENGIALGAYSEAEIEQQVDRLLRDPECVEQLRVNRHSYFQANPQLIDGKATERVVNLLQQLTHRVS